MQCSQRPAGQDPSIAPEHIETPRFEAGKYFRIEEENGRWWLVTPEGQASVSFGVNHVTWHGCRIDGTDKKPYEEAVLAKYGSPEAWAKAVCARLEEWGFNTIGAWSSEETDAHLLRTPILHLTDSYWKEARKEGRVPDFYAPAFEEFVNSRAEKLEEDVGDPALIGYFIDNELPWAPDHRKTPELFDGYAAMPAGTPGKARLVAFLRERHETVDAFNAVWKANVTDWDALATFSELKPRNKAEAKADREAFTLELARQYFRVTAGAIRAKDPGRLVLGCRLMPYTVPKVVVQACGEYCDVISINFYEQCWGAKLFFWWQGSSIDRMPQGLDLSPFFEVGKKPLMVTEFTSRLKAKGQNTWPPPYAIQPVVRTQAQRVARYERQVMTWARQPWFVGSHWFEHADQPKEGRAGDGENSIFGLVNIEDEPYEEFVKGVTAVHERATAAHALSTAGDGL